MQPRRSLLGRGQAFVAGAWRPGECMTYTGGDRPHRLVRLDEPAITPDGAICVTWTPDAAWRAAEREETDQ